MNIIAAPLSFIDTIGQTELRGTAVSRGVAVGKALCLFGSRRQFFRIDLPSSNVDGEIDRFRIAVDVSIRDLSKLATSESGLPVSTTGIFEVHLLILEQSSFIDDVKKVIAEESVNAEWALKSVTDLYVARQSSAADPGIREKYVDVQDVAERIMSALVARNEPSVVLDKDSVVVASVIRPSTLVEMSDNQPLAIVTEQGGWTSHAFIMAREMGIPAVTGFKEIFSLIKDGDDLLVDGYEGRVVLRPSQETIERSFGSERGNMIDPPVHLVTDETRTLDGREIVIRANAELLETTDELDANGASGIGLLRSEYLFGQRPGSAPTEEEQVIAYRSIAELVGEKGVRIRTFDQNADQQTFASSGREANPALGLRAIRLSFANEVGFRTQIRAILRASAGNNVDIILPMVTGLEEIHTAKRLVEQERALLRQVGVETGNPGVGVMIEVPSAVITIDEIVNNVDFVCLGTNDLVQYLLAVDRDNGSVADWYQTLHPAVVMSIRSVLKAAEFANIPAVLCGEMAGSPFYTPLLIGLGAREFSMNINSIATVRRIINGISFEETAELAAEVVRAQTASDAESLLKSFYAEKWPHLFPSGLIERQST